MSTSIEVHDTHHHQDADAKVVFGFWIFVLSDFILFATLFVTYAVLRDNTFGGISIKEIADLPVALTQTLLLLTSCLTYGLGLMAMQRGQKKRLLGWLGVTFVLGLAFVASDYHHMYTLFQAGHTWQDSAFLSAYYSLLGIQWVHMIFALLWILIVMAQLSLKGLNPTMKTRFACLGLFWDFLNIIWMFIFALVYLMGAI